MAITWTPVAEVPMMWRDGRQLLLWNSGTSETVTDFYQDSGRGVTGWVTDDGEAVRASHVSEMNSPA